MGINTFFGISRNKLGPRSFDISVCFGVVGPRPQQLQLNTERNTKKAIPLEMDKKPAFLNKKNLHLNIYQSNQIVYRIFNILFLQTNILSY